MRKFYFSHGVDSKTTHQPAKQHMDEERSKAGQWSSLSGKLTQLMVLRYNKKQPKTLLLSQVQPGASLLQISQQFSELQKNLKVVRVMPTTRIRGTPQCSLQHPNMLVYACACLHIHYFVVPTEIILPFHRQTAEVCLMDP